MALRFRYEPPRFTNTVSYLIAFALVAVWLETLAPAFWRGIGGELSLFAYVVPLGFAFYFVWFWFLGGLYLWFDRVRDDGAALPEGERSAFQRFLLRAEIQSPATPDERREPDVPTPKAVNVVLRNQFLGTLPVLFLVWALMSWRGVSMEAEAPRAWVFALQLFGCVLVEEVLFYTVHRTLHRKDLFRRIHRIHHEYRKPTGITTHYVHYVEHLLGNLLPVFAGPILLAIHPLTFFMWIVLALTNAVHTHGGYAFAFHTYAHDHDFHHYRLRGNYGAIGLLDRILRTDREFHDLGRSGGE